ncbi:hypothetical protein CA13_50510 [Planctomycetes bacterium CA13]|uniref:Uncharacterized protein n=1 Tax=Novipirellula herctigrandis TaxID=2527986 RepID=A0A5C5Z8F5_9BACT|nr:hypothetical protein CA13_50510 [Planctomycetes bacterium CA13]
MYGMEYLWLEQRIGWMLKAWNTFWLLAGCDTPLIWGCVWWRADSPLQDYAACCNVDAVCRRGRTLEIVLETLGYE